MLIKFVDFIIITISFLLLLFLHTLLSFGSLALKKKIRIHLNVDIDLDYPPSILNPIFHFVYLHL